MDSACAYILNIWRESFSIKQPLFLQLFIPRAGFELFPKSLAASASSSASFGMPTTHELPHPPLEGVGFFQDTVDVSNVEPAQLQGQGIAAAQQTEALDDRRRKKRPDTKLRWIVVYTGCLNTEQTAVGTLGGGIMWQGVRRVVCQLCLQVSSVDNDN